MALCSYVHLYSYGRQKKIIKEAFIYNWIGNKNNTLVIKSIEIVVGGFSKCLHFKSEELLILLCRK